MVGPHLDCRTMSSYLSRAAGIVSLSVVWRPEEPNIGIVPPVFPCCDILYLLLDPSWLPCLVCLVQSSPGCGVSLLVVLRHQRKPGPAGCREEDW